MGKGREGGLLGGLSLLLLSFFVLLDIYPPTLARITVAEAFLFLPVFFSGSGWCFSTSSLGVIPFGILSTPALEFIMRLAYTCRSFLPL
ncbi:hypothetical protein B0T20DRAFT_420787 [Sordaria brevicollis]|uniref:Uncharacterized protein n=1 Tax=Sordaria brevicollis TaxID=83679 RepID=A0AAE0U6L3_SORBR|nr:hypothetical protein B0T20DRAFT_420787 [Sordaria brevicollis]